MFANIPNKSRSGKGAEEDWGMSACPPNLASERQRERLVAQSEGGDLHRPLLPR